MRAKTLLLTAVLTAAGVASAAAQVYSVNMVGYVNLTLKPGLQMICNPLNNTIANGNTVSNLFVGLPDDSVVYKYDGAKFVVNPLAFGEWASPDMKLEPGEGCFLSLAGSANVTVLFVGDVLTGTPLTTPIPAGLSIVSSKVPQAGKMATDLKYTPEDDDTVYQWNFTKQTYDPIAFQFGEWSPAEPVLFVGESVFLSSKSAKNWQRNFTVEGPN